MSPDIEVVGVEAPSVTVPFVKDIQVRIKIKPKPQMSRESMGVALLTPKPYPTVTIYGSSRVEPTTVLINFPTR